MLNPFRCLPLFAQLRGANRGSGTECEGVVLLWWSENHSLTPPGLRPTSPITPLRCVTGEDNLVRMAICQMSNDRFGIKHYECAASAKLMLVYRNPSCALLVYGKLCAAF